MNQAEKVKKSSKATASGMTQEELAKAQEEMFAASRKKFDEGPLPSAASAGEEVKGEVKDEEDEEEEDEDEE